MSFIVHYDSEVNVGLCCQVTLRVQVRVRHGGACPSHEKQGHEDDRKVVQEHLGQAARGRLEERVQPLFAAGCEPPQLAVSDSHAAEARHGRQASKIPA